MSEPIPIVVRRYRCPHCARSRASRAATVKHIGRCWSNPDVHACRTCRHYDPGDDGDVETGYPGTPEQCAAVGGPELAGDMVTGCPLWATNNPEESK